MMDSQDDKGGSREDSARSPFRLLSRRGYLTATMAGTALFLSGCFQEKFFDIEWDEEVRLMNGRVIVVHVKRTYERLSRQGSRDKYERSIPRSFTLSFDAGPPIGAVTQTFDRMQPTMLDTDGHTWYLAMMGAGGTGDSMLKWPIQPPHSHSLGMLKDSAFSAITVDELPPQFTTANMLIEYDDKSGKLHSTEELIRFNGQRVTLDMKTRYVETRFRSDGRMYRLRKAMLSSEKR